MQKKLLAHFNVDFGVVHQMFVTDQRKMEVHWNNTPATYAPRETL
jgi:hypothetical protein